MIRALLRACCELFTPALRRVVATSLALTASSFALLWTAVAILLNNRAFFVWPPLNWLVDMAGAFAAIAVTWLLFPAVATLIMGFYLDRVAAAVEALDYPGHPPPRRRPMIEAPLATIRLMALTLVLNLMVVPIYLLLPGMNFFVFLTVNGYLFGRGYFEVVALRRLDMTAVKMVRNRFGGRVFVGGLVIAGLFASPLVNLVAPVIATAFMLHIFEGLRRTELQPVGS
ncbi:MAG: EI24 domain-containing protein [Alphaproteobacteria bacterium]|nr:EI24 domain-containing protein [Alphaproteobacteria bacterium]